MNTHIWNKLKKFVDISISSIFNYMLMTAPSRRTHTCFTVTMHMYSTLKCTCISIHLLPVLDDSL